MIKRLVVAALLVAGLCSPAFAQLTGPIYCNQSAAYDAATNGATRLITAKTNKQVLICGFVLFGGGTANVGFVSGTGTNCGTGQANVTPQFALTAQSGVSDQAAAWRGLQVGSGLDICIKTSAGVAVQGVLYFNQD